VVWNDAIGEPEARRWLSENLGTPGGPLISLSVRDVGTLLQGGQPVVPGLPDDAERVVLISKGWEPPLLEFADLLKALRACTGENATFVVVPINTRRSGIDRADREIWAEFLGRQQDPRLYVMQDAPTEESPE
jgi:hypothetical protein